MWLVYTWHIIHHYEIQVCRSLYLPTATPASILYGTPWFDGIILCITSVCLYQRVAWIHALPVCAGGGGGLLDSMYRHHRSWSRKFPNTQHPTSSPADCRGYCTTIELRAATGTLWWNTPSIQCIITSVCSWQLAVHLWLRQHAIHNFIHCVNTNNNYLILSSTCKYSPGGRSTASAESIFGAATAMPHSSSSSALVLLMFFNVSDRYIGIAAVCSTLKWAVDDRFQGAGCPLFIVSLPKLSSCILISTLHVHSFTLQRYTNSSII